MILDNIQSLIEENKKTDYSSRKNYHSTIHGITRGAAGALAGLVGATLDMTADLSNRNADKLDHPILNYYLPHVATGTLALGGSGVLAGRFAHLAQKEEDDNPNDKHAYWRGVRKELLASAPGYAATGAFLGHNLSSNYDAINYSMDGKDPQTRIAATLGSAIATPLLLHTLPTLIRHARHRIETKSERESDKAR